MTDRQGPHGGLTAASKLEIARYLRSGKSDTIFYSAWPGKDLFERARHAQTTLREALVKEVLRRAPAPPLPVKLAAIGDMPAFTRRKVMPMINGMFPLAEREVVLGVLAHSAVLLTPANIAEVLRTVSWDSTAWKLANLYLVDAGAKPLSKDAPRIVGLSKETTCFVAMSYFEPGLPLEDFLVHEAAHVFHNCKRDAIGLASKRNQEWLLPIDFCKRETFAYACEAFGRLLELCDSRESRNALLDEHADGSTRGISQDSANGRGGAQRLQTDPGGLRCEADAASCNCSVPTPLMPQRLLFAPGHRRA